MSNVNTFEMYKAIVSLENEVDQLKRDVEENNEVTYININNSLNNYYTKSEAEGEFVVNDYVIDNLTFTNGTMSMSAPFCSIYYSKEFDIFVAVTNGVTTGSCQCIYSEDGKTFKNCNLYDTDGTLINDNFHYQWYDVSFGKIEDDNEILREVFIVSGPGRYGYSTDGKTFHLCTMDYIDDVINTYYGICYGDVLNEDGTYQKAFVMLDNSTGNCVWITGTNKYKLVSKGTSNGTNGKGGTYVRYHQIQNGQRGIYLTHTRGRVLWSTDGKKFNKCEFTNESDISNTESIIWYTSCSGKGIIVVSSRSNVRAWSTDGKTFTYVTDIIPQMHCSCYGNGLFVLVGYSDKCLWSTDGKTFNEGTISNDSSDMWDCVCYGKGMYVALTNGNKCAYSMDGYPTANSFALKKNTYTKAEVDDKINEASVAGADLSNYIHYGVNEMRGNIQLESNRDSLQIGLHTVGATLTAETGMNLNCRNNCEIRSTNGNINLIAGGSSTLAITSTDVTFKGQSLINNSGGGDSGGGNYIVNGENNGNVNIATNNSGSISVTSGTGGINISGGGGSVNIGSVSSNGINLTSQGSTLAITQNDVTFKGNSLISGVSGNYVVNGENNNGVNITTDNTNNISLSAEGTGEINLSSKYRINLRANTSRFVVTPDDVTFNDSSFIVNGTNNKNINIKTGDGNSITIEDGNDNIIDFASMHGIKLTSGGSTLNITADDVIFKNQSLIVDTSNFIINGDNGHDTDVNITGKTINLKASGNAVLTIRNNDITFKNQSLIVDTSNFIVNGANNEDIDITTGIGYIKLSSDNSINLSVNNSTLTVTSSDVTFKGQSLINNGGSSPSGNYVVNGQNSGEVNITSTDNINITSQDSSSVNITTGSYGFHVDAMQEVTLSVGSSTLAITADDVTFNGQSLIVDTSGFITNGTNNGTVNIDVVGNNGINMKTYNDGDGGYGINLTVGSSTLAITDTGVTFKDQFLILNGQNNGEVNINTSGNYINIIADSRQHGSYGINLIAGSSTLAIIDTDVMFKGQSLIVDTSNFIVNDYEKELSFTDGTISAGGWYSVCYGNGMFIIVSNNSKCAWSTDGKTFTDGTISTGSWWYSVYYGNGMFITVSNNGKCAWSTDGKTFTDGTISTGSWYSVCYGNGMFVAVGNNGKCAWSTDGKTFTDGNY